MKNIIFLFLTFFSISLVAQNIDERKNNRFKVRFGTTFGMSHVFKKDKVLKDLESEGFFGPDRFKKNSIFSFYIDVSLKRNLLLGFITKTRSYTISVANHLYTIPRTSGSGGFSWGGGGWGFSGGSGGSHIDHRLFFGVRQKFYNPKIGWIDDNHRFAVYGGPSFISETLWDGVPNLKYGF